MLNLQQAKAYSSQNMQVKQTSNHRLNIDGDVNQVLGERASQISWDNINKNGNILQGHTDFSILSENKGSIMKFWNECFAGKSNLDLTGNKSQIIQRRLFQLQHEIEGLLRRKINFSFNDADGGKRFLDYTNILNEKENHIVELEKKIQNLQERLRRASQREIDLESQILRLKNAFLKLQRPGVSRFDLESLLKGTSDYKSLQLKYNSLRDRLGGFASLIKTQSEKLKTKGVTIDFQSDLYNLVRQEGINVSMGANGIVNIIEYKDRVVEIPVSDARTKHLIHILAVQIKKLFEKYPKLKEQIDTRLTQFFQQELIDIMDVDQLDRVVEIVKYVPDIYRVENVYAYSSEKSRRVQFHLRVLIKALLEQLEKLKARLGPGQVLDLDEGVIGMINAEILNVVNVDDILKVFRVVPKIVQVEKIVQKIVDRVIQVPQVVQVQKIIQKIIQVPKIVEIQRIVYTPVEIVKYVDVNHDKIVRIESLIEKVVQVPQIIQKIVQKIIEVPKLITQQIIVEKIVQVQKPTIVQKIIHVPVVQIQVVEIVKEKIVEVQTIIQKPYPVQVIVEKIVQVMVHVPQLVVVEKRNDVLAQRIVVQNVQEVINHIQKIPEIVEFTHQKSIPFIQTVQRIIQVPKIIQKIVQVVVQIPIVKQVVVIEQKIVFQDRIIQVQKVVTKIVELIKQVQKIIQIKVQVPVFHQIIMRVPQIITQIAIERIQYPVIVQVEKFIERIVEIPKIIQVEKQRIVEVVIDNPVNVMVEKIVEVPRVIEKIKEVRVSVQKIVQKMVEVPKVIQVQKIVEKIVLIPRVIDKIVEVPEVVEKIVQKVVQITKVVEVEKIIQVPLFFQTIRIVEVPIKCYYNKIDAEQYEKNNPKS